MGRCCFHLRTLSPTVSTFDARAPTMQQEFLDSIIDPSFSTFFFNPGSVRSYIRSFWAQVLWALFPGFFKAFIIWGHVKVSRSLQGRFNLAHSVQDALFLMG